MKIGDEVYNVNAPELGKFTIKKFCEDQYGHLFVYGIDDKCNERGCLLSECKLVKEEE